MNNRLLPPLPCLCANLRRAARALTQVYAEALRPLGLRSSQFTILQALTVAGELTQGDLGRILAMDSTTLTRTLAIMSRHRWIARHRGDDRREWRLSLSQTGKACFDRALPAWERAQARVRQQLGSSRWDQLMKLANEITNAVTEQGELT
jgi:DNA-binding MarR family transcriptional regulator